MPSGGYLCGRGIVVHVTRPEQQPAELAQAGRLLEALGSLRRQLRRTVGRPWPVTELTGSQIELVRLVRREPGIPVSEAAERLGVAANTVSTLVRQLTDAGLLRREADPADRRVARLQVTAAARRRIEGWRDRRAEAVATALERLHEDDRRVLAQAAPALERLVAVLHEPEERP
jgi:DNA-binding MarR family transcriptional regulator